MTMRNEGDKGTRLASVLSNYQAELLEIWLTGLTARWVQKNKTIENEIRQQAAQLLPALVNTLNNTNDIDIESSAWAEVRQLLNEISSSRVRQGLSSTETASLLFSLKDPLFGYLRTELNDQPELLSEEFLITNALFDRLGLFTVDAYQKSREKVIARQQQELLELSTPVVQLWQNIIALPLIGTLDS